MARLTITRQYANGDEMDHLPAGAFDYDGSCLECGKYRVGFYTLIPAGQGFIGWRAACTLKHAETIWARELSPELRLPDACPGCNAPNTTTGGMYCRNCRAA